MEHVSRAEPSVEGVPQPGQHRKIASAKQSKMFDAVSSLFKAKEGATTDWEALIGGSWLNVIGIVVFVVGMALLAQHSLRQFEPVGKISTGVVTSIALLVLTYCCGSLMAHQVKLRKPVSYFSSSGRTRSFLVSVAAGPLAAAIILPALQPTRAIAQDAKINHVDIAYIEPQNRSLRLYYDTLQRRRVLEELQELLSPLRLPHHILVETEECGRETVHYQPGKPIVACYEYVARIVQLAPPADTRIGISRERVITGAFVQLMLHETARAIFDLLQIPVWGREEDAADKLAAYVMLQFGKEVAVTTLTGSTWFFEASNRTWTGSDFAQEGSPEAQRFYNYLCVAYGADPATFTDIVRDTLLKTRRAARCADEYKELSFAFTKTILPYVDPEQLRKIQSQKWLRPEDQQ